MSSFKWLEIAIISGIPIVVWWMQLKIQEQKDEKVELLKNIQSKINNKALLLDKKIDLIEINISFIKEELNHRAEIINIKFNFLSDKINDIESYLKKINGYQKKRNIINEQIIISNLNNDEDLEEKESFE
jgi:hypothetical protein